MNFKKFFNVKKTITHKIITILGIKIKIKRHKQNMSKDDISYICVKEMYSALEVSKLHTKTFPPFEYCHANDNIAIIGCGPSIKYYNNELKTINIALNDAVFYNNYKFDYLFNWDTGVTIHRPNWNEEVNSIKCKKFYGHCLNQNVLSPIKTPTDKVNQIYHFYYSSRWNWPAFEFGKEIHQDISTYPLADFGSVSFGALHFALWTYPKKIFLIGLDTTSKGRIIDEDNAWYPVERMMNGYVKFKDFITSHYPNVEIISINPVGLKGLFRDVYTQSYVDAHPELKNENVEILKMEETENAEW